MAQAHLFLSAAAIAIVLAAGSSLSGCDPGGSSGVDRDPAAAGPTGRASQTASATGSSTPGPSWQDYRSERGRYSVRLPGKPTERTLTWTSTEGNADVVLVELKLGDVAFGASHTEYPQIVRTHSAADQKSVLDAARDSLVHHVEGKLVDETPEPIGKHPGRRLTVRQADGQSTIHGRMLLAGSVLYQLTVTTPGSELPAAGTRFLESFRLSSQAAP